MPEAAAVRWWRALVLGVGLLLSARAGAQGTEVLFPPTLLAPNYNRIFPGLTESIEAGAAMVRASTPPAIWYNPAGLVLSTRTTVNASVQGYQLSLFTGSGTFNGGTQESNIRTVPSFVGIVLGEEAIHLKNVRFGFGMSNPISWQQGITSTTDTPSSTKLFYGVNAEFEQYQAAAAVSWAVNDHFRLGFSLAIPYTYLSNGGQLSGTHATGQTLASSVRTASISGYNFHLLPSVSFQWEPLPWLGVGGMVAPPALRVFGSGGITLQGLGSVTTSTEATTRQVSLRDTSASFDYFIPAELSAGLAFHFGKVEFEVDAHWYLPTGPYTLFQSSATVTGISSVLGSPPKTTLLSFPPQVWGTRNVVNLNVGGSVKLSELISILAGFYSDHAPGNMASNIFQPFTFYGVRAGISFNSSSLSGSVGLGYEYGTTTLHLTDDTGTTGPVTVAQSLTLQTLSLLFALAYTF
jgi:hypothetical protein